MAERRFQLDQVILHLPILDEPNEPAKGWYVRITNERTGRQFAEFYMAITAQTPDFYCPLYLHGLEGECVVLSCGDENVPEDLFDGVLMGGTVEERQDLYPDMYREPERQQIHFSSRRGWLNDPNGLVYVDGTYHMCYQHNPYGPGHGGINVSWGMAVSPDGVHFKEYPDAIRPWDALTHIASGSAIVDRYNIAGYGKDTVLATYTALGSALRKGRTTDVYTRGQMLEYSTDGGFTFRKFPHNPIIPVEYRTHWRDPKILQIDEESLCIAVYETHEGKDCVSFYSSRDCVNWKFQSRMMDLYECPDMFRLPVMETGETLWVLYGGSGMCRIGKFENFVFTQIAESQHLDYGNAFYAGQTWNSHPDPEHRYHIAWIPDGNQNWGTQSGRKRGTGFSQFMTLICRFELHAVQQGYRLFRQPMAALDTLRMGAPKHLSVTAGTQIRLENPGDALFAVDAEAPVTVCLEGSGFTYEPENRKLRFTSGKEYTLACSDRLTFRVVTDTRSVEFFICDEISATFLSGAAEKILHIEGQALQLQGDIWKLESIWK